MMPGTRCRVEFPLEGGSLPAGKQGGFSFIIKTFHHVNITASL